MDSFCPFKKSCRAYLSFNSFCFVLFFNILTKIYRMSPLVYSEEGKKFSEQLWKETMDELAFAKPQAIFDSLVEST